LNNESGGSIDRNKLLDPAQYAFTTKTIPSLINRYGFNGIGSIIAHGGIFQVR
jgi:hypothetical protein